MDRRGFLRFGGTAGLGASAGAGCIKALLPPPMTQADVKQLVAEMDRGLAQLDRYDMLDSMSRASSRPARFTSTDRDLSRMSVRSLFTSAVFRNMPAEVQLHPAVQERVVAQMPEMDEAIFSMTDRMETVPAAERGLIARGLREDRGLPDRMGQRFDHGMSILEMSYARRTQVRSIFSQVGWRMQRQSPGAVIDEYVDKMSRVTAKIGSQAELERRVIAQMGGSAYWRQQQRIAQATGGGPTPSPGPAPTPPPTPPTGAAAGMDPAVLAKELAWLSDSAHRAAIQEHCETVEFISSRVFQLDPEFHKLVFLTDKQVVACLQQRAGDASMARPSGPPMSAPVCPEPQDPLPLARDMARNKVKGTGGWMLGIGFISGIAGAVLVATESDGAVALGAFGLTLGAVLIIGGLIVMAVGAGMKSSSSP
jgi:hypothetical protein